MPPALAELGVDPPFHSRDLWAFFDSSYRLRADVDYLAPKWRAAGIAALQVAAWHYWESDPASDEYLRRLIEACHRNAILVYAWFELPHASDKFWDQHPEWREKTALLQDAQLNWRKLMNLQNPNAFEAVAEGVRGLLGRFDWDGANLAGLYFESLEGAEPRYWKGNPPGLKQFLDFRAGVTARQQAQWIEEVEQVRKSKPHLDFALTHVDDRFDSSMREEIAPMLRASFPC